MARYSSAFVNWLDRRVVGLAYWRRYVGEYVNLWRKRGLIRSIEISAEDKHRIQEMWKKNYGKTIPLYWHRLYASYTGMVDVNYFPEVFYSTILERNLNDAYVAIAYEDKSMLDVSLRFPGEIQSHTVQSFFSKVQGTYYNSNHSPISEREALDIVDSCGRCVIKPSIDSDSGRGVRVLECVEGRDMRTGQTIEQIIAEYHDNFLVQTYIRVHPTIKELNPTSVNTIRIITYILDGSVYHTPLAMRIGASDADVDNIHAGGLVVGVGDDGLLNEIAFSEFGEKYKQHPVTGLVFGGYKLPAIDKAIALVTRSHSLVPRLTFISWDVTIDENVCPVIVEMNTRNQSAWFPQMVNGKSLFGEHTASMIQILRKK